MYHTTHESYVNYYGEVLWNLRDAYQIMTYVIMIWRLQVPGNYYLLITPLCINIAGLVAAEAVAAMLADDLATQALSDKTSDSIIYKLYKDLPQ